MIKGGPTPPFLNEKKKRNANVEQRAGAIDDVVDQDESNAPEIAVFNPSDEQWICNEMQSIDRKLQSTEGIIPPFPGFAITANLYTLSLSAGDETARPLQGEDERSRK